MNESQSGRCPKCSGEMERGFLRYVVGQRFNRPVEWVSGSPEVGWNRSLKIKDKARCWVEALRCRTCGYLEQYARNPQVRSGLFDI